MPCTITGEPFGGPGEVGQPCDETGMAGSTGFAALVASDLSVPDWNEVGDLVSIYPARIAVVVEDLAMYNCAQPGVGGTGVLPSKAVPVIRLLKASLQAIRAAGLSVGIDVRAQHVHLVEGSYQNTATAHSMATNRYRAIFPTLGMHRDVSVILRLIPHIGGGSASGGGPCVEPGVYRVTRAGFSLQWLPSVHGDAGRAQEVFHTVLGLRHTPCYLDGPEPLERCPEGKPTCWQGGTVCTDHTSFMGYCWNVGCSLFRLEFAGYDGGMWRKARANANAFGGHCLEAPTEWVALAEQPDTDDDGVADWQDNCREVANAQQTDHNDNGVGDACASCAVGATAGPAWPLLGPLLLLWRHRRLTSPR
jgi:hypothetical protein